MAEKIVGISAKEINPNIDLKYIRAYLDIPEFKKDAQKILSLQEQGLMDAEGNPQASSLAGRANPKVPSPRDYSGLAAGEKVAASTKAAKDAAAKTKKLNFERAANLEAVSLGKAKPFPNTADAPATPVNTFTGGITGYIPPTTKATGASVTGVKASGTGTTTPTPPAPGDTTGASVKGASAVAAKEQAKRVADSKVWASYLRTVFNTIPDEKQKQEVLNLVKESINLGISEQQFVDRLKSQTVWGQTTGPAIREFIIEQNDPRKKGLFLEHVRNTEFAIKTNLEALGVNINQVDPVTNKVMTVDEFNKKVTFISTEMLRNGWKPDSSEFKTYLSNNVNLIFSGGGTLGTSFNAIQARAWQYGQDISKEKNFINSSLLDETDGRDANWWLEEMKRRAMDDSALKPYAEGFALGRTLDNQTTNVRKIIGTLLEVDPTNVSWDTIKKYAIKYDDKGNALARNDSEVTKEIKKTPEWGLTKNGKETYVNMAESIKQMFGMVG